MLIKAVSGVHVELYIVTK